MLGGSHPVRMIVTELASTLPETEANTLMGLFDTTQVRAWTQQKVTEDKNHVSTLLAIYNSIAPINTLPTEILQEIFAHVPEYAYTWCDALWLLSMGLVCRRWHLVLLATPEYWARGLHTVMDPDYYECYHDNDDDNEYGDNDDIARRRELFLARSAPFPLEITLRFSKNGPGWEVFEDHFDRVAVFEVIAKDGNELDGILNAVTSSMKRLKRLQIRANYPRLSQPFFDWEAKDLPYLGCLEITSALSCCVTTVPSLHTVILTAPPRDIKSLPWLLDALEKCSALTTLRLKLMHDDNTFQNQTLKRVLKLPNLRTLAVGGDVSDVRCFLSSLSFSSTTLVELDLIATGLNEQDRGLVLPNVLPKRISAVRAHQLLDGIDRLCFYSNRRVNRQDHRAIVSMQGGYSRCTQRLRVHPAFWLHNASQFLEILTLFRECRVVELALDLRHTPRDMDGQFWAKFFTSLPDLRRLELLSPNTWPYRGMKRDIAIHYLASCRVSPQLEPVSFSHRTAPPQRTVSLAWVLHATDNYDASQLETELAEIEQILSDHAYWGARVGRLELYITTSRPDFHYTQVLDVTQVKTLCWPSRLVARDYVPRLEAVADIVVVGGGWGVAELDGLQEDSSENESSCDDTDEEDSDSGSGSGSGSDSDSEGEESE